MRTLALETDPLAVDVTFSADVFRVALEDGRELSIPLAWFPRLLRASPEQRRNWELIGRGEGVRWDELDEDISVAGSWPAAVIKPAPARGQPRTDPRLSKN